MPQVISLHEYELKPDVGDDEFLAAVERAAAEGLFVLPGLTHVEFGRGLKGARAGHWCALWTYESKRAWQSLWGTVDDPIPPSGYPFAWRRWEDEMLGPLLAEPADEISYTSYAVLATGGPRAGRGGSG